MLKGGKRLQEVRPHVVYLLASFLTALGGKVAVMIFPTFISFYSAIQIQETSCVLKKCWLITFACSCAVDVVVVVVKHMSSDTI